MNRWCSVWRAVLCGAVVLASAVSLEAALDERDRLPVTLRVDFGPAGKPAYEEALRVDKGSTPKDVVSLAFPIQSGATCCDTREVAAIDGVRSEPAANRWWTCQINGSKHGVSPYRTKLRAGDRVEWIYVQESQ